MSELCEKAQEQSMQKDKYLTFKLEVEFFALEIGFVKEIYNMLTIVPMPCAPDYVKGIINLRGKIIPVLDMRLVLGKESRDYSGRTCIIILYVNQAHCGLIVDTVSEVCGIPEENIEPPPGMVSIRSNRYLKGIAKIGNELAMVLDCEEIMRLQDQEVS